MEAPSRERDPVGAEVPLTWAGPRVTAAAMLAIGIVALVATFSIPGGKDPWALSGPRVFPLVAAIGLILCALAQLVRATLWRDADLGAHAAREASETEWRVPALVGGGLIAYVFVLEPLGYVLATALFFPFAAWALGSRAPLRDAVSGIVLAVGVYLLFTQMLAVALPSGLLGF